MRADGDRIADGDANGKDQRLVRDDSFDGRQYADGVYNLYLERPLVCFNLFHLIREMDRIPADATGASLHSGRCEAWVVRSRSAVSRPAL